MEVPGETSRRGRDTEPFSSDKVHSDDDKDDGEDDDGDGDDDADVDDTGALPGAY